MFVQAAVESLPEELAGIASEVLVQFPWGSLLRGVAAGDELVMRNLRRVCVPKALLHVTLGLDLERDRCELERLELPAITIEYARTVLAERYLKAGFRVVEVEAAPLSDLTQIQTSWARRLHGRASRSPISITAQAD